MPPCHRPERTLLLPAFGDGDGNSGSRGGGDIHPPSPEYHISVHCESSVTEVVSDSRAAARSVGDTAVEGYGGIYLVGVRVEARVTEVELETYLEAEAKDPRGENT